MVGWLEHILLAYIFIAIAIIAIHKQSSVVVFKACLVM